jgi:hypothetical protein
MDDPQAATLDHLVCHSVGGSNDARNLVTCCGSCNSRRQDKKLSVWLDIIGDDGTIARNIRNARRRVLVMG